MKNEDIRRGTTKNGHSTVANESGGGKVVER